jgi:3-oxoacyl-[acyl-carrier-protein] synthase III
MSVGFETLVKYLPGEVLDVREHYSYLEPAMGKLPVETQERIRATAPHQVRRLKDVSAAEIMALGAGRKALDSAGIDAGEIDALFVTQTGGKQFMPLLGSYVHLNLGLKKDAIVRNVVDDNTGVLDASFVAWNFVKSGLCKRVLVIAVAAQIGGQTGFGVDLTDPMAQNYGDGAAAAIVSAQNLTCEFLSYHCETYPVRPRTGGTLIANIGQVRPLANPDLATEAGVEDKPGAYLILDDPLFDRVAGRRGLISESLSRALEKAGLGLGDVQLVITPHVGHLESGWMMDLQAAGLPPEACRNFRSKYGNLAVAESLVDLAEFGEQGDLPSGSVVALWAAGVGVQLAVLVVRWGQAR